MSTKTVGDLTARDLGRRVMVMGAEGAISELLSFAPGYTEVSLDGLRSVTYAINTKIHLLDDEPPNRADMAHGDLRQYAVGSEADWIGDWDRVYYDEDEAREVAENSESRAWVRTVTQWEALSEDAS